MISLGPTEKLQIPVKSYEEDSFQGGRAGSIANTLPDGFSCLEEEKRRSGSKVDVDVDVAG